MPAWFVVAGVIVAGGWAVGRVGDALEDGSKLVKWGAVAGGVYVSYQALKSAGALK